jgi:hypothetical protein
VAAGHDQELGESRVSTRTWSRTRTAHSERAVFPVAQLPPEPPASSPSWSYRVDFEGHEEDAAALGLKKRLWDTLVGDDSKFVSCTLAPDEKKKKRARA